MKRVRFLVLAGMAALLAITVIAPVAGAKTFSRLPGDTEIYGYVHGYGGVGRSYWEMPIATANVYLHDSTTGEPILMDTTDSWGDFDFSVNLKTQKDHKGEFSVSPAHFFRATTTIHNHPNTAISHNFMCQVWPTNLTGKVINKKTKKPIAGAKIQILNWDVKTNKQGVYRIAVTLKPNTDYSVWCNKSGYKRLKRKVKSKPSHTGATRTLNFQIVKTK